MKHINVYISKDNISHYDIDDTIFDDPYMEAITRAVENSNIKKGVLPTATIRCWNTKTPKNIYMYNSYWVMVNAGLYKKAELLREKFKLQHNIDLSKEPVHGNYIEK